MNILPEERLHLWNLFQACDLDRDGLIDVNDIRSLCRRTEFSEEYTPEAIMDLFDMTDDIKIGFEDFVAKKKAHDQLAYSESTSISSDLTNQTADETSSLLSDQFAKELSNSSLDLDSFDYEYDHEFSDDLAKVDNYCEFLPKKLSRLNLNSGRTSGYTTNSSLRSGNHLIQFLPRDRNENKNISTRLEQLLEERSYMREKINKIWMQFNEEKKAWNVERQRLKEKIVELESIVAKLSIIKYDQQELWTENCIAEEPEVDLDIEENRLPSTLECLETPTISKDYLVRLSNQLAEKTLYLSEMISNLRNSEIGLLMANCRAAGLGRSVYLTDDDEQEEIMRIYEQAVQRRSIAEQEAVHVFRNWLQFDKDFLMQYLSVDQYRHFFKNNKYEIVFDCSFETTLVTLLAKFKRHFMEINTSINNLEDNKSSSMCDDSLSKSDLKPIANNFPSRGNVYSVKFNSL